MENRHQCYYCLYNNEGANACNLVYLDHQKNEDGKMNYPIGDTCPCFADCCDGVPDDYLDYMEEIEEEEEE